MRLFKLLPLLFTVTTLTTSAQTLSTTDALQHVGEKGTVCGETAGNTRPPAVGELQHLSILISRIRIRSLHCSLGRQPQQCWPSPFAGNDLRNGHNHVVSRFPRNSPA